MTTATHPTAGIDVIAVPTERVFCRAKVFKLGWCRVTARYIAIWEGQTGTKRTQCTRPLCSAHAKDWCERRGLTFPAESTR